MSTMPTHPLIASPPPEPSAADQEAVARRRRAAESRVEEISSLLSALEKATLAVAQPAPAAVSSPAPAAQGPAATASPALASASAAPVAPLQAVENTAAPAAPATPTAAPLAREGSIESRLIAGRLGLASSVFAALKARRPAAAAHSLRVALGCSSWASYKQLDDHTRDTLELAGLFHDVGSIGLSDAMLETDFEAETERLQYAAQRRVAAAEILYSCGCPAPVVEVVRHVDALFTGNNGELRTSGDGIPLEARMIAVVDAYDALTSQRDGATLAHDEAMIRLTEMAGTRLDPILVAQFADVMMHGHDTLTEQVAVRWLGTTVGFPWPVDMSQPQDDGPGAVAGLRAAPSLFEQKLVDAMHDGVLFVDAQRQIFLWSKGAERLSGVSAGAAMKRRFAPSLLDMCNNAGRRIVDDACPVLRAIASNSQIRQRLEILGRNGRHVAIDLHAIPVLGLDHEVIGATVLLHDAQPEATLEEKCEALHAKATKDPMTKVANRAEFDRMQLLFMEAHEQADQPCSLIMTDIDHFKRVNDTYGHQSGDEAIITLANLLKEMCRAGDLVARYGGEEFAVLCADCNIHDAARRADQIRRKLADTPLSFLGNKRLTASFGVSQLQPGDTPEAMLKRADLALYTAKEQGRNQVVKLGDGMDDAPVKRRWWNFGALRTTPLIESKLACEVPKALVVEKLRGYVGDMHAKVVSSREDKIELELSSDKIGTGRRRGDRVTTFRVELRLAEVKREKSNGVGLAKGTYLQTEVAVSIRPKRGRNRREAELTDLARIMFNSVKSYLMASEVGEDAEAELARV